MKNYNFSLLPNRFVYDGAVSTAPAEAHSQEAEEVERNPELIPLQEFFDDPDNLRIIRTYELDPEIPETYTNAPEVIQNIFIMYKNANDRGKIYIESKLEAIRNSDVVTNMYEVGLRGNPDYSFEAIGIPSFDVVEEIRTGDNTELFNEGRLNILNVHTAPIKKGAIKGIRLDSEEPYHLNGLIPVVTVNGTEHVGWTSSRLPYAEEGYSLYGFTFPSLRDETVEGEPELKIYTRPEEA
ncbi:hypothetical protein KJ742_00935 [Patescibacteria group bacterium]|nr:hypothetical protein [Patescibacteria group bacterium]MBU1682488.1 hypothetical protein [Patescibacteria group bacterium]MBU1935274.1 hypothetical protein [Patescibacteria group bacterium]